MPGVSRTRVVVAASDGWAAAENGMADNEARSTTVVISERTLIRSLLMLKQVPDRLTSSHWFQPFNEVRVTQILPREDMAGAVQLQDIGASARRLAASTSSKCF
jgi:hypothetical protein